MGGLGVLTRKNDLLNVLNRPTLTEKCVSNVVIKLSFKLKSFQPCPAGTSGTAYWTCAYGDWYGSVPDFSNCTTLDFVEINDSLNATDSVPAEVIDDVNAEIQTKELASGDIEGLIEVVDNAIVVRKKIRLSSPFFIDIFSKTRIIAFPPYFG